MALVRRGPAVPPCAHRRPVGDSSMRGRLVIATVAVGILLAATAVPGTTSPVSAVECPAQPLAVGELTALWDHGGYAGFMGLVNHNGRRCYGDADLTVVGYVDSPEGIGGVNSFVIKPLWMTMSGLMLMSGSAADRHGSSWFYPIAMPPRFGDLNERYHHRWVAVTAHFDDPRALTCRAEGPADTNPPSKAQAVRMCRSILVL